MFWQPISGKSQQPYQSDVVILFSKLWLNKRKRNILGQQGEPVITIIWVCMNHDPFTVKLEFPHLICHLFHPVIVVLYSTFCEWLREKKKKKVFFLYWTFSVWPPKKTNHIRWSTKIVWWKKCVHMFVLETNTPYT